MSVSKNFTRRRWLVLVLYGIIAVIRQLAEENMTMVIVTHEMIFARDVADRIVFMDGGVIVEEGPAQEVINNPKEERTQRFLNKYQQ